MWHERILSLGMPYWPKQQEPLSYVRWLCEHTPIWNGLFWDRQFGILNCSGAP